MGTLYTNQVSTYEQRVIPGTKSWAISGSITWYLGKNSDWVPEYSVWVVTGNWGTQVRVETRHWGTHSAVFPYTHTKHVRRATNFLQSYIIITDENWRNTIPI